SSELNVQGININDSFHNRENFEKIEQIRIAVGKKVGIIKDVENVNPNVYSMPKIAIVSPPNKGNNDDTILKTSIDVFSIYVAVNQFHPAYPVSGAIALGTAAKIPNSIVNDVIKKREDTIKIGHPSGIIDVTIDINKNKKNEYNIHKATVGRTARTIMKGECILPER